MEKKCNKTKYLPYMLAFITILLVIFGAATQNDKIVSYAEGTVIDVKMLKLDNGGGDYNGEEYTVKAQAVPNVTVEYQNNGQKDAGATMVTAIFTPKVGYTLSTGLPTYSVTAMIVVVPKQISATFIVPSDMREDGTLHKITAIPVGVVPGDQVNFVMTGDKNKLGGYYTATILGTDNPNYSIPIVPPSVNYIIYSNRLYSTENGAQNGLGSIEMGAFIGADNTDEFTIKDIFTSREVYAFPDNKTKEAYYMLSFSGHNPQTYNIWIKAQSDDRTGYEILYVEDGKTKSIAPLIQDGYLKFTLANLGEIAVVYEKDGEVDIEGGGNGSTDTGNTPKDPITLPWWFWLIIAALSVIGVALIAFVLQTHGLLVIPFLMNIKHTISFESNGGSELDEEQYGIGELITCLEDKIPNLDGCDFVGWYSDVWLTKPFNQKRMPAKNIKLYAKWL